MTDRRRVQGFFEQAINGDESQMVAFVKELPNMLKEVPHNKIHESYIPFLVYWVPRNNTKICLELVKVLPTLFAADGPFKDVMSFIEALTAAGNEEVMTALTDPISALPQDALYEIVSGLIRTKYDIVRCFGVRFIGGIEDKSKQEELLGCLVRDTSYKVRKSVILIMNQLDKVLASRVAEALRTDLNPRIRSLLATVASFYQYFSDSFTDAIVADYDWSVRASVAIGIVRLPDPQQAYQIGSRLVLDNVWQVKLASLRSLTSIFNSHEPGTIDPESLFSILPMVLEYNKTKIITASIDTMFAMLRQKPTKNKDMDSFICSIFTNQPYDIRLHFLGSCDATNIQYFREALRPFFPDALGKIATSDKWKLRLKLMEIAVKITELFDEQEITESVTECCRRLATDKAEYVRELASKQFVTLSAKKEEGIPQFVENLVQGASFRERQIGARILAEFYAVYQDEGIRSTIIKDLDQLSNDPCSNVAYVAKEMLKKIQAER